MMRIKPFIHKIWKNGMNVKKLYGKYMEKVIRKTFTALKRKGFVLNINFFTGYCVYIYIYINIYIYTYIYILHIYIHIYISYIYIYIYIERERERERAREREGELDCLGLQFFLHNSKMS